MVCKLSSDIREMKDDPIQAPSPKSKFKFGEGEGGENVHNSLSVVLKFSTLNRVAAAAGINAILASMMADLWYVRYVLTFACQQISSHHPSSRSSLASRHHCRVLAVSNKIPESDTKFVFLPSLLSLSVL